MENNTLVQELTYEATENRNTTLKKQLLPTFQIALLIPIAIGREGPYLLYFK
jgi:hypothetical protein